MRRLFLFLVAIVHLQAQWSSSPPWVSSAGGGNSSSLPTSLSSPPEWRAGLARIRGGTPGSTNICVLGDSWVAGQTVTLPLRRELIQRYGDAGLGYASAATVDVAPTGVTLSTLGTWANVATTSAAGADGYHATSSDTPPAT